MAAGAKNRDAAKRFSRIIHTFVFVERYADIVLPLFQPLYTFAVPDGAGLGEGDAVAVQFGAKAVYTGIVWRLHDRRPDVKRVKSVGRRLYDRPLLTPLQMRFWEWIADYYMCTLGEVMRMALPAMAKPRGGDEEEFMMAVAEAGWSPQSAKSFDSFVRRMQADTTLLDLGGYRYSPHYLKPAPPRPAKAAGKQ